MERCGPTRPACRDDRAPARFFCPITLAIMVNPMADSAGQCFERSAILEWLWFGDGSDNKNSTTGSHPLTRQPLHPDQLSEDEQLRQEIEEWRLRHSIPAERSEEKDEDEDDSETFFDDCENFDEDQMGMQQQEVRSSPLECRNCETFWLPTRLSELRNKVLRERKEWVLERERRRFKTMKV